MFSMGKLENYGFLKTISKNFYTFWWDKAEPHRPPQTFYARRKIFIANSIYILVFS